MRSRSSRRWTPGREELGETGGDRKAVLEPCWCSLTFKRHSSGSNSSVQSFLTLLTLLATNWWWFFFFLFSLRLSFTKLYTNNVL